MSILCRHDYMPLAANRGENALGCITYSVDWKCRRCLRVKHEKGYSTDAAAQEALRWYRRRWNPELDW